MSLVRPLRMSSSPAMKKRPPRVPRRPRTTSAAHMNVSLACATRTNLHTAPKTALTMEFPPFELLHWFERTEGTGFLHISHSETLGFRFSEFGKEFPDLDLGEAFP